MLYDLASITPLGIQDDDDCDSEFWKSALQEFGDSLGLSQPSVDDDADPVPLAWASPSDRSDEDPVGTPKSQLLSDGDDGQPVENPKASLLGEERSIKTIQGTHRHCWLYIYIHTNLYIYIIYLHQY